MRKRRFPAWIKGGLIGGFVYFGIDILSSLVGKLLVNVNLKIIEGLFLAVIFLREVSSFFPILLISKIGIYTPATALFVSTLFWVIIGAVIGWYIDKKLTEREWQR
jgi:hypothetical protein